jgi:hypothetical protein
MAELETPGEAAKAEGNGSGGGRGPDEVALDMMKFIAVATGYGKSGQSSAGFSGKPAARSAEEHAESLIELFKRCRKVVKEE